MITPTCFGPYWPIIKEHTIVQESFLKLSFPECSRTAGDLTMWYVYIYIVDGVVRSNWSSFMDTSRTTSYSNYCAQLCLLLLLLHRALQIQCLKVLVFWTISFHLTWSWIHFVQLFIFIISNLLLYHFQT